MMDRPRNQSKTRKYHPWLFTAVVILLGLSGTLIQSADWTTARVDASPLRIDQVQRGNLTIEVSANGQLLPSQVEWIAAQVQGRVARIHARAGERVAIGDVLIELSNPDLGNAMETAQSALEGAKAEYISYEVGLQNDLLNQKSIALRARFALEAAQLKLDAETELRKSSSIIADINYKQTQLQVDQLRTAQRIEKERLDKSTANMSTQLAARQAQVDQLARALERAHGKVEALVIRAGMDGMVQQMDLEIGQRLSSGMQVAIVARENQLYAELDIQARQASDIALDQSVLIDTRQGLINGHISRIDPAVRNGTVTVDVALDSDLPDAARPELKVEGKITVAHLTDVLYVGKPIYSREESTISLYCIDESGDYARRKSVQTGLTSANYLHVVSGLSEGDQIILSDSSDWQQHDKIRLN